MNNRKNIKKSIRSSRIDGMICSSKRGNILIKDIPTFSVSLGSNEKVYHNKLNQDKIIIPLTASCSAGSGRRPRMRYKAAEVVFKEKIKELGSSSITVSLTANIKHKATIKIAQHQTEKRISMLKDICLKNGFEFTIKDQQIISCQKQIEMLYGYRRNKNIQIKTNIELKKIKF